MRENYDDESWFVLHKRDGQILQKTKNEREAIKLFERAVREHYRKFGYGSEADQTHEILLSKMSFFGGKILDGDCLKKATLVLEEPDEFPCFDEQLFDLNSEVLNYAVPRAMRRYKKIFENTILSGEPREVEISPDELKRRIRNSFGGDEQVKRDKKLLARIKHESDPRYYVLCDGKKESAHDFWEFAFDELESHLVADLEIGWTPKMTATDLHTTIVRGNGREVFDGDYFLKLLSEEVSSFWSEQK